MASHLASTPEAGFLQLPLPLDGLSLHREPPRIPRTRRVFVNRNLKLAGIDWVGFDMDYTLAIYRQGEMDRLSIAATLKKLVARGYPELLGEVEYALDFAIRGLLIDKRLGHVLKMDRYKVVQKGYHGLRPLSREEIRALYQQSRKIRPTTSRYHWIDTLYALSEVTLYAGIVEALERRGLEVHFARLFADIRESIDEAHRDGTILDAVLDDLPRYVERDPALAPTLHKLRSAGKRLFLLTNSRWPYTDRMMTYLLGGALPEYPTWRHYFDVVIVAAQKPAFFQEHRPLFEREGDALRPVQGSLERGRIYEGGNLHDLERHLATTGDRVLYVGDHIYGDILRSKKESSWRTAMIIQEMEAEVQAHEACRRDLLRHDQLMERREGLEDHLRELQLRLKELARRGEAESTEAAAALEAERVRSKRALERVRGLMRAIDAETTQLEQRIDLRFHPYWGSLLKEATETSSFGDQVEEYACLYTSRVSNLFGYSPVQYFRSPRDLLPHEL